MLGKTNSLPLGIDERNAMLVVSAPAGSTVTATKSSKTLEPDSWTNGSDATLYNYIFTIKPPFDNNNWTVTATNGTKTKSATIAIVTNRLYTLDLRFELYFIKNGIIQTENPLTITAQRDTASLTESGNVYANMFSGTGPAVAYSTNQNGRAHV